MADMGAEKVRGLRQQPVADVVAVNVVDALEVVEIDHQHGQGQTALGGGGDGAFQQVLRLAAVRHLRQIVGVRQMVQFPVGGFQLRRGGADEAHETLYQEQRVLEARWDFPAYGKGLGGLLSLPEADGQQHHVVDADVPGEAEYFAVGVKAAGGSDFPEGRQLKFHVAAQEHAVGVTVQQDDRFRAERRHVGASGLRVFDHFSRVAVGKADGLALVEVGDEKQGAVFLPNADGVARDIAAAALHEHGKGEGVPGEVAVRHDA